MNPNYKLILSIAFSITTASLIAQPAIAWGVRYNGPPDMSDEARDIVVDAAGNSYVTGSGFNSSGNLDAVTVKYDVDGNQVWVRSYDRGVSDNDEAKSIAIDASGNVYVTGYSKGSTTSTDALTVKYDNAGNQQWVAFYNGTYNQMDEGRAIAVDASGNIFICGYSSDSAFLFDALTVCYDNAGTQQWAQIYDGPISGNDELLDLVIDGSSNVYVTGNSEQASFDYDFLTIKYNLAGSQQWLVTYAGPAGGDYGKAITLDPSNNVIVGGMSGFSNQWFDYLTVKYSNSGVQQWTARYNNGVNRFEDLWDVATDNAGYVYVTGQSQSIGNNSAPTDCATVKYTPAGNEVWVKRYDGGFTGDDRAYAIALDDTANVYVAGYSKNASNFDFITIKYDSAGTEEFVLRFNSQYNQGEQINAMAVMNGDIYVTGKAANISNDDFLTIRYSYSAVGINESHFSGDGMRAYPVPANDILNIEFNGETNFESSINIVDVAGRVVLTENVAEGTNTALVDISSLATGMYTLVRTANDGTTLSRSTIIRN